MPTYKSKSKSSFNVWWFGKCWQWVGRLYLTLNFLYNHSKSWTVSAQNKKWIILLLYCTLGQKLINHHHWTLRAPGNGKNKSWDGESHIAACEVSVLHTFVRQRVKERGKEREIASCTRAWWQILQSGWNMPRCPFPDAQTKSSVFHCWGSKNQSWVKWCLQNNCGICRSALGVTDGWGLAPGTEDCLPDCSYSHGKINTETLRQFLSWFDWQAEKIGNQFVSYFICYSGFSGKFQPLKLQKLCCKVCQSTFHIIWRRQMMYTYGW